MKTIAELVGELLLQLDPYPGREGLKDTPARVQRAMEFLTKGHKEKPEEILARVFESESKEDSCGEMVLLKDIEYYSLCEHHIVPFYGKAHIAYIPNGKVVGISKLARLVDCFARRLQIQERMSQQIADAIMTHLKPVGCGVIVEGIHLCMRSRGVAKQNSTMVTSALRGEFKKAEVRAEFLKLVGGL